MTLVQKNMARLSAKMAATERRLEAMNAARAAPSAIGDDCNGGLEGLIRATASDTLSSVSARLRALHDASDDPAPSGNPFGRPASADAVIDSEFTVVRPRE